MKKLVALLLSVMMCFACVSALADTYVSWYTYGDVYLSSVRSEMEADFAKLNLTNTPWAMIIPSLVSTFGLYLMWIFSEQAVPQELLEAARVDGASEFRTFWQISLPLLAPGIVTTALFTIVATWNNYFLPLIMLKDSNWYPLTIGLNQWKDQASTAGGQAIQNLVITGSLITIIPLVIAFLCLQKYWQSGLAAGAVKE